MDKAKAMLLRSIGARIKQAREEEGLSQAELGARLGGVDGTRISRIERGGVNLGVTYLIAIARLLSRSPDWLLVMSDDPTPRWKK